MVANPLLFGVSLLTLLQSGGSPPKSVQQGKPQRINAIAFEMLAKSLRCDCGFNVCALIEQRDPMGSDIQRVKVDRNCEGQIHKLVVGPLATLGIESLDDGNRWQTILPDDNLVLDQVSPAHDRADADKRLRLARKNYRFELVGETVVAGRRAVQIQACPLRPQLACRRYVLDYQTLYPLKEESVQEGRCQLEFVTLQIAFPNSLNEDEFELHPKLGMRVLRFERPQSIHKPADAQRLVGFTPYMPKGDPLGFEPQEMQISQDGKWQALVVRLSDGLARATLYEYRADVRSMPTVDNSSKRQIDGIDLMVVCPLGPYVRKTLLDSLVAVPASLLFNFPVGPEGTSAPVASVPKVRAPNASR